MEAATNHANKIEKTYYEYTFNARWMTPDIVARSFLPIPEFQHLVGPSHSVLLGPRGCGKTTLLKMLTRQALQTWKREREPQYKNNNPFEYPEFEAIYIPSDVRWLYELNNLEKQTPFDAHSSELMQRAMISISFLQGFLDSVEQLIGDSTEDEIHLCTYLIGAFELRNTAPALFDIRITLENMVRNIRGTINIGNPSQIDELINKLPKSFVAHAVDTSTMCCTIVSRLLSKKMKVNRWALCYDELEIAPSWLRKELFESLRSIDQKFLLKLTSSPMLPSGLATVPQAKDDFVPIRLWHSHVMESRKFCEALANSFLYNKFQDRRVTPQSIFAKSPMIHDDPDKAAEPYDRNSMLYLQMKELAQSDASLRQLLQQSDIDPEDPYTDSIHIRDTLLRKIAPIVLLRATFTRPLSLRSRKNPRIYTGETAIYTMSEGNPRWLLGLLNDLYDMWKSNQRYNVNHIPIILPRDQARVLKNAAERFQSYLSSISIPHGYLEIPIEEQQSLFTFLNRIGTALQYEVLFKSPFPVDPIGSFIIDRSPNELQTKIIDKAMVLGAIVFIGDSNEAVPQTISGKRFRLSHLLAPIYKLPLRNDRGVLLTKLLKYNVREEKIIQANMFTQPQIHKDNAP